MITLNKSKIGTQRMLGILMLVVGLAIGVLTVLAGDGMGYANAAAMGGLIAGGVYMPVACAGVTKRYGKYFDENKETTIANLAQELGISEKKVVSDLEFTVGKSDRKKLKNCEGVKFEA